MPDSIQEAVALVRLLSVAPDCYTLNDSARAKMAVLAGFLTDPRGWPEISEGRASPAHSPVDRYRCENEECDEMYSVWEFRPDDYSLDETAVGCPSCGEECVLFFRWFRGGDRG